MIKRPANYLANAQKQGLAWVAGKPYHCKENDECAPDFSCCYPKLFEENRATRIEMYNRWAADHGFPLAS